MANSKISALSAITTLASTDEVVVASGGATKKMTGVNLQKVMRVPHIKKSGTYTSILPSTGDATMTPAKDNVLYIPFPVYEAITIDRISLGVSGAGTATSVVRLGIYSSGSDGRPSALVLDAGTIDGTSATYQEKTVNQALNANTLYWAAVCWQVAAVGTLRALAAGNGSEFMTYAANSTDPRVSCYDETGVTGAFGGTATPAISGFTTVPAVKVRVV